MTSSLLRLIYKFIPALFFAGLGLLLSMALPAIPGSQDHPSAAAARVYPGLIPGPVNETNSEDKEEPSEILHVYMPLVIDLRVPELDLLDVWTSDSQGVDRSTFLPGVDMQFWVSGTNNFSTPTDVYLEWTQEVPCGESLVYSDTVTIDAEEWVHSYSSQAPDCGGLFTPTVKVTYQHIIKTLSTQYVVNQSGTSTVFVTVGQGFDRCALPEVDEMATWWEVSPYRVFNLYIGGENFYCSHTPVYAAWVQQVAQQGWTFIETWVGPQSPCFGGSKTKMSRNTGVAYDQGRTEAESATQAAIDLGFTGDNIIYYDIEGYADDGGCRLPVKAFMRGWVERLHELGMKAGAYGAGCTSFVSDWATIDPAPDDVWIAHWIREFYDADVTVWDARCVSDELWADQRRLKQYAGDHVETWGGVALGIDSNVLDGEINALGVDPPESVGLETATMLTRYGDPIQAAGLLSPTQGWVLSQNRLLLTNDGGINWRDISPTGGAILNATFYDGRHAWALSHPELKGGLVVSRTHDGGATWQSSPLQVDNLVAASVAEAYFDPSDTETAWLALKLRSGSSFSAGRLFLTEDGGMTWQERTLPLGEAVYFLNSQSGWVAGGPAGDHLYFTGDGGRSWERQDLNLPVGERASIGLPKFSDERNGRLLVGSRAGAAGILALYETQDGGLTWAASHSFDVDPAFALEGTLAGILPALAGFNSANAESLLARGNQPPGNLLPANLPQGTLFLDFFDDQHAWAVVQSGRCEGDKLSPAIAPLRCNLSWGLLATDDGSETWYEISLPER